MGAFGRHLGVLLRKNALLKRRKPCALASELLLAIAAISLLALARYFSSHLQGRDFPAEHHIEQSLPVRLPDCAEFLPACSVSLDTSQPHSATCVQGVTFGCEGDSLETGKPGVWTVLGCYGAFHLKSNGGEHVVHCHARDKGPPVSCPIMDDVCENIPEALREPCGWQGISSRKCLRKGCCFEDTEKGAKCFSKSEGERRLKQTSFDTDAASVVRGLLSGKGQAGIRRLDATFAIAPREGGTQFHDWLVKSNHPWSSRIRVFDSAEAVQSHLEDDQYPRRSGNESEALCGAVIFETSPWAHEVKYSLRFNRSLGFDPNIPAWVAIFKGGKLTTEGLVEKKKEQDGRFDSSGLTWYAQSGFLSLQRTVDTFIEAVDSHGKVEKVPFSGGSWFGEDGRPHIVVPFPSPAWSIDIFSAVMPQALSSFLLISLTYSVSRMVTSVVHEREARLRDGMRMMGMHPAAFYVSWSLTYVILYLFVVTGVVIILVGGKILPRSSPSLLFAWLMLFAAAAISYGLLITSFFTRAKTAATVGSILFYSTSYLKYLATPATPTMTLRALSLLPPVAFELGADLVAAMESQQVGATWTNAGSAYHNYSLLESAAMLALDAVLFFILFLYLDQVLPREVGLQRPWYFPLLPSYWKECVGKAPAPRVQAVAEDVPESNALVEQDIGEAASMMARSGQTVELRKLSKSYGSLKAVQNLDLVMYQGEVFALLGHNGAGKTTTLQMLCGLNHPTSGVVSVFGHVAVECPAEVQRLLGVCPQHDVLWEELSCEEHLQLFAGFKGVAKQEVDGEVASTLERVGLQKAGASAVHAGKLSGGMKRKLSLGIAFIGGSRLVVLDEPTSGLDPFSRRSVWELLRSMKHGRVTVLSTHYMDEADILGDRIAILHEGRLRCCGSPQFLKRAYDCGYNVTFVKKPGCDADAVREAVCHHVPELTSEVVTLSNSAKELILQFPFTAARHFPKILGSLEQQLGTLLLESYGISITTLEEVFLKVASGDVVPRSRSPSSAARRGEASPTAVSEYIELGDLSAPSQPQAREVSLVTTELEAKRRAPGAGPAKQVQALLLKRWRYGIRDKRALLCQLLMPTVSLLIFLVIVSRFFFRSQPPLLLSVEEYKRYGDGAGPDMVEFSHLPSLDAESAQAVLEPTTEGPWQRELRYHAPPDTSDASRRMEEALFAKGPGIFQRLSQGFNQRGRRLSAQTNDLVLHEAHRRLASILLSLHSAHVRLEGALEAVSMGLPRMADVSPTRRLRETWSQGRRPEFRVVHDRFSPHSATELDWRVCPGASSVERMIWFYLDHDADGVLSRQDIRLALRDLEGKVGAQQNFSVSSALSDPAVKAAMREQLGFDLDFPIQSERELDNLVQEVLEDGLLFFFDGNGNGVITEQEFCAAGRAVREEVSHFYDLATHFSQQILDANSSGSRFGAFYVVAKARTGSEDQWLAGADAVVFANTTSKHSPAVYQAALTNTRLARLGKKKTVSVTIHLFPQTKEEQVTLEQYSVFMLSICMTFCLSFIPAGITHYLVKERTSGARQLQALSGASHGAYWLANFIYDVLLYVPPALSVPFALKRFGFHTILEGDCGAALFAVLAAFGPAIAGFSYFMSFFFKDHAKASSTILSFCLVGATILSTVLFVLTIINYDPTNEYPSACDHPTEEHPEGHCRSPEARLADRILGPIFRLVPTVCVYQALFSIALVAYLRAVVPEGAMDAIKVLGGKNVPKVSLNPWDWEWAGEPLAYLAVEGILFFLLAIFMDMAMHSPRFESFFDAAAQRRSWSSWVRRGREDEARQAPLIDGTSVDNSGDDSVWAERERAAMVAKEDLALHVWGLEKVYRRWLCTRQAPKRAVRGLSFAIHSGEVFGLLGHNGAGKTSAIKCFVGEQCITAGTVHVGGCDMERDTGAARRRLGYCPQFDALLELLTVQDHLELYASIRGLPKQAVEEALQDFKLEKNARRRAEVLSGGNRRKLSAALALMGSPSLAILDEPSCGLDPAARRALWTAVHDAVAGCSWTPVVGPRAQPSSTPSAVLLTTHSMEEAEALSSRLGIMAEGQLLTVGTAQQIKEKHGSSQELVLRLRPESEEALGQVMRDMGSELEASSVMAMLESTPWRRAAYYRPRCIVRLQLEQRGCVEASVLAEWWLQQAKGHAIEEFLQSLAGDRVELAEDFGLYWRFRLPRSGLSLPQLFQQLEENSARLGMDEYTVSQATLEQIFNSITEGFSWCC